MDLFSLALNARYNWALAEYACDPHSTGNWQSFATWMERAECFAFRAGHSFPEESIPHLLADVPFLTEMFENGVASAHEDREAELALAHDEAERQQREAARQLEHARIDRAIAANDWDLLHLPTPEKFAADVATGKGLRVNGYFLIYDGDDDMTWYTNPYGQDGVLSEGRPSVECARRFLRDMARRVEYGLVP